ncbi:MAG: pilus assembly protein PilM [Candidatus Omnitrophota bacterium]
MKPSIGIEIGEEYLKVVTAQAERRFLPYSNVGPSDEKLPARRIIDRVKLFPKVFFGLFPGRYSGLFRFVVKPIAGYGESDITAIFGEILKKKEYKGKSVVMSLARNFVTVRNLRLPSQDKQEVARMIDLHIDRIVPYKKEDVVFSYQVCGTDDAGYARVVLAIVHSEIIYRQIKILEAAGILVDKVILSSCGVWQRIVRDFANDIQRSELYLALDVDTTFTDLIIFNKSGLIFTRGIGARAVEINRSDIGQKKFLGDIRQSLLIFYNEEINRKPKKIFLSGAIIRGLADVIGRELEIPVEVVSSPAQTDLIHKTTEPDRASLTAVAQLLSDNDKARLSFPIPEIEIRKSLRDKTKDLMVFGGICVYCLGLICLIFLGRIYNRRVYLGRLKENSAAIENELGDVIRQLKKIEFIKGYLNHRRLPLFVVYQLQRIISDDVALSFIRMDEEERITLRGKARHLPDVFRLITRIEKLQYVDKVQTEYTRKKKFRGEEITDFELSFMMKTNDENKK